MREVCNSPAEQSHSYGCQHRTAPAIVGSYRYGDFLPYDHQGKGVNAFE